MKVILDEAPYNNVHSAIFALTEFFSLPTRGYKGVQGAVLGNPQSWTDLISLQNIHESFRLELERGRYQPLLLRSWSSACLKNADLERIESILRNRVEVTIKGLDGIVEELGKFGRDFRDPAWEEQLAISLESCSAEKFERIIKSLLHATKIARKEAVLLSYLLSWSALLIGFRSFLANMSLSCASLREESVRHG